MESIKSLLLLPRVFTNKLLFTEWILEILKSITMYFLKIKANIEIDLRKINPMIQKGIIYDQAILKERWDACSSCEFLTADNKCNKCGCFMKVKHKLKAANCPVGKWKKYVERSKDVVTSTI